jgi:GNAT superfamily N-acetyltransferase
MYWRQPKAEQARRRGEGNRRAFRTLVNAARRPPGLLAYLAGEPAGWVAVEPKSAYPALLRSRRIVQVDDRAAWAVTCLFVARPHRGRGVARALVEAAATYAERHGARIVEAYPLDTEGEVAASDAWTGLRQMYDAAGFEEVARAARYLVMRRTR